MSLVEREDMTKLRTAAESRETAATAEHDVQLKAVAHLINQAANTGVERVTYQGEILDSVREELLAKGYFLRDVGGAYPTRQVLIIWQENPILPKLEELEDEADSDEDADADAELDSEDPVETEG